jgi:hypothetical protein
VRLTLLFLTGLIRPHTAELGRVEGTDTFRDLQNHLDAHRIPGLLIYRIDDLDAVGIDVSWARVRQSVIDMLERSGLMDRIGSDDIFLEVDDAVADFLDQ